MTAMKLINLLKVEWIARCIVFAKSTKVTMLFQLAVLAVLFVGNLQAHKVLDLSDNFEGKINELGVVLVKFYAPWCGHCKNLAPKFEEASDALAAGTLAKVDCTSTGGKETCSKLEITGYPTLKLFRNGKYVEEYRGGRNTRNIIEFVESMAMPAALEIFTVSEFDALLSDKQTLSGIVFGFFENDKVNGLDELKGLADLKYRVRFAYTTNEDIMTKAGYKNKIVFYTAAALRSPKLEQSEIEYSGSYKSNDEIIKFILANRYGLCGVRTPDNINDFSESYLLIAYTDVDLVKKSKNLVYVRNRILKAAQSFTNNQQIKFAISDTDDFMHELKQGGFDPEDTSKINVVLYEQSNQQKYKMESQFSADNIVEFIKDVMDGKIEPTVKSEPIPENPTEDDVHVVVAKTFKSIVMDNDKDVFIEFYAPWCGHCKQLAPILSEVAKELSDESNLLIAKMNAADNEVMSQFEVRGYPTMYFIPKNKKNEPILYDGGRTKEDFIKFFVEHSTEPLTKYKKDDVQKEL
ncbi:hypothetical protein GJ496_001519 [Pomphorhynchus laevis]|nr:hypothetical protein GJ496_001519 [Pomphorhynchus laevis]